MEVYGCPTPGYYGENCSLPCPQTCQESNCNIVDGTCPGCNDGYRGPTCNEKCSDGTYGLECGYVCGNCSDGDWCNHVNGSCPNGCDVGVFGDRCDRGKMHRRKHRYTSYQHEFEIKEEKNILKYTVFLT
eukprot:XP_019921196.1 PREDICTED: scavenger receptor class F member 2-like [Crassostrea gigas]